MPRVVAYLIGLALFMTGPALGQTAATTSRPISNGHGPTTSAAGRTCAPKPSIERVEEFGAAIELYPKYTMAHYSLGRAYMSLRRIPMRFAR